MDRIYRNRKFSLAVVFTAVGVVALFTGYMGGGEFIGLSATVLGLYGAANLLEARSD